MTPEELNINRKLECFDTKLSKVKSGVEKFFHEQTEFKTEHKIRCNSMEENIKTISDKVSLLPCVANTTDLSWIKKIIWIALGSGITGIIAAILFIAREFITELLKKIFGG